MCYKMAQILRQCIIAAFTITRRSSSLRACRNRFNYCANNPAFHKRKKSQIRPSASVNKQLAAGIELKRSGSCWFELRTWCGYICSNNGGNMINSGDFSALKIGVESIERELGNSSVIHVPLVFLRKGGR